MLKPPKKIIILDRDGVINFDSDAYIKSPDEWLPIPGSLEAIAELNRAGYIIAIATNQSGIGRKLYTETTLATIHQKMQAAVKEKGGIIDKIFYCPHTPEDHCSCRKPQPGLFYAIAEHYDCSLQNVICIGDSLRDIEAAVMVGCKPFLVLTGKQVDLNHPLLLENNVVSYPNLSQAVAAITNKTKL